MLMLLLLPPLCTLASKRTQPNLQKDETQHKWICKRFLPQPSRLCQIDHRALSLSHQHAHANTSTHIWQHTHIPTHILPTRTHTCTDTHSHRHRVSRDLLYRLTLLLKAHNFFVLSLSHAHHISSHSLTFSPRRTQRRLWDNVQSFMQTILTWLVVYVMGGRLKGKRVTASFGLSLSLSLTHTHTHSLSSSLSIFLSQAVYLFIPFNFSHIAYCFFPFVCLFPLISINNHLVNSFKFNLCFFLFLSHFLIFVLPRQKQIETRGHFVKISIYWSGLSDPQTVLRCDVQIGDPDFIHDAAPIYHF